MRIIARKNSKYNEVQVLDGNSELKTGLLNDEESLSLAKDLISTAEFLLDPYKSFTEIKILEVLREGL